MADDVVQSAWPPGTSEMAARIRAHDWAGSALGPVADWPQSLKTAVDLMLASPQPAYIAWGSELTSLFNDGYIPILGSKHPDGLGQPYAELFAEIWDEYRPLTASVLAGTAHRFTDQPVALAGRPDRPLSWFSFSWMPLRDDRGAIAGFLCLANETTDRVLAQRALEKSEQQFRTFTTASADILYRMSADWTQMRQLDGRGFLLDTTEPRQNWMSSYIASDDQPMVWAAITKAIETRSPFDLEHRVLESNGALGWTHSRAIPMIDEHGEISEWFGVASDITKRKHAEIALRESDERQAFLLKLSDALRSLSDPEAILAEALRVLGEHLEVTRVIFAERDDDDFVVTRDFVNGVPSMVGRYPKGAFGQYASQLYSQSGRAVISDVAGDPALSEAERTQFRAVHIASYAAAVLSKEGGISIALAAHHNVPRDWTNLDFELIEETAERTWAALEHARAEVMLRDSEERLRQFGEASQDILWIRDATTLQWTYLTPAFDGIYGLSRQEVLTGDNWRNWGDLIVDEDRARAVANIMRVREVKR